jgi:hypothetical protein
MILTVTVAVCEEAVLLQPLFDFVVVVTVVMDCLVCDAVFFALERVRIECFTTGRYILYCITVH